MRNALARALSAAVLIASTGCEPCAGVINCVDQPILQIGGRVLDTGTGLSAPGVPVRIITRAEGFTDSVTTTTTSDGTFLAALRVPVAGLYGYELTVTPPGLPGYTARGRSCLVQTIRGSGCDAGPIGTKPYFPYLLSLVYRGPDSIPVRRFAITFRQTAGSPLYGDSIFNGVFKKTSDEFGGAQLLGLYVFATMLDSLIGDVTVRFTDTVNIRRDTSVLRAVRLVPTIKFREGPLQINLRVGPSLAYSFMFSAGSASTPVSGVKVQFTRTSGIATATETSLATSDASGRARINLRPLETGSVTGTLSVEPPAPWAAFSEVITLATHDDDLSPVARSWNLGASPAVAAAAHRPR